jgi:hypothetical protein
MHPAPSNAAARLATQSHTRTHSAGYGSGRSGGRPTVESAFRIDLDARMRHGFIRRGARSGCVRSASGWTSICRDAPEVLELFLREPDGTLSSRSLLADRPRGLTLLESKDGRIHDRRGAYTCVSDRSGRRYESRYGKPARTSIERPRQANGATTIVPIMSRTRTIGNRTFKAPASAVATEGSPLASFRRYGDSGPRPWPSNFAAGK